MEDSGTKRTFDIGFIGAGITGTALAVCLFNRGYPVKAVSSKRFSSACQLASLITQCTPFKTAQEVADTSNLIFITTPDDIIATIATNVHWHDKQHVVHCSGAHSIDILMPARNLGAYTGCFHPLQTFAGTEQAIKNMPGSTFGIEAEEPLLSILQSFAQSMKGDWVILKPEDKILYHVAAVFASNYLVTLVKLATDLWQEFGISNTQAIKALMPLIRGTLNNLENIGLPDCLTGPIARGDIGTVKKHLHALLMSGQHLQTSYKELGQQTIPIALAKGKIDTVIAKELQAILK
jgi:predicted short-subunit dehydrogenase-like oxidoreductase (DUF2520 family)